MVGDQKLGALAYRREPPKVGSLLYLLEPPFHLPDGAAMDPVFQIGYRRIEKEPLRTPVPKTNEKPELRQGKRTSLDLLVEHTLA